MSLNNAQKLYTFNKKIKKDMMNRFSKFNVKSYQKNNKGL